jgi:hypothetical protein
MTSGLIAAISRKKGKQEGLGRRFMTRWIESRCVRFLASVPLSVCLNFHEDISNRIDQNVDPTHRSA